MRYPRQAIWRNSDYDQEVTIVGYYGKHEDVHYFKAESGTGIPRHQLIFKKESIFSKIRRLLNSYKS